MVIKNVYSEIPVLENDRFILRAIREEKDADDLLKPGFYVSSLKSLF